MGKITVIDYLKELESYNFPAWSGSNQIVKAIYQEPLELAILSYWVEYLGVKKYLEIGLASGALMHYFTSVLGLNGFGIDIEMPPAVNGDIYIGNSHASETVEWAKNNAPYDMVFLDADHSYEAIKKDWELYENMVAKMFVFHDIGNFNLSGPRKIWSQIEGKKLEVLVVGANRGIGILFIKRVF